jgi:hypothetical protein
MLGATFFGKNEQRWGGGWEKYFLENIFLRTFPVHVFR